MTLGVMTRTEKFLLSFLAADSGLTIIPLVQTIGHMEFALKHEQWRGLREVEAYPSSICPSNSETMPLIRSMIKQIVAFHPNIQYLHIGADEVIFQYYTLVFFLRYPIYI